MRLNKFMKYMMNEAVPISLMRQFKDDILSKKYKNYLNDVFKGEDRLYIDFIPENDVPAPAEIGHYIKETGEYEILDYKKGLAKSNKGRLMKIGKILVNRPDLLKIFQEDKNRAGGKKSSFKIVISRHPYDIAGMSTGRGWTSCMNLKGGAQCEYVARDIKEGSIVAYVIDSDDENIEKPMARIIMKPFINVNDPSDILLFPEQKIYGTNISGFRERIIKWLESIQRVKDKALYHINPKLYADDIPTVIGKGMKDSDDEMQRIAYYISNPDDPDAKADDDDDIRKQYYKTHPNDPDAKKDWDDEIVIAYYERHPGDKDAKKEKSSEIRYAYYEVNPKDPDAKKDKDPSIRMLYYKYNPNDSDAAKDRDEDVRNAYFERHPEEKALKRK